MKRRGKCFIENLIPLVLLAEKQQEKLWVLQLQMRDPISSAKESIVITHFWTFLASGVDMCSSTPIHFSHGPFQLPGIAGKLFAKTLPSGKSPLHLQWDCAESVHYLGVTSWGWRSQTRLFLCPVLKLCPHEASQSPETRPWDETQCYLREREHGIHGEDNAL